MHILTKVFVLFAAVLSILLSALTISYTINTDQIVSNYNDALEEADTANASLKAQAATHGLVVQEKDSQIQDLRAQLTSTKESMSTIDQANAQLRTDLRAAQAEAASANRRVQGALEATKAQAQIIEAYKDEVTNLRNNEIQSREQALQLEERVSNLQSQLDVQTATIRALREELASAKEPEQATSEGGIDIANAQPIPGSLVRGTVQSVSYDSEMGRYLVQINLGENDRMKRNARVHIVRGSDFIADLVIINTDLNVSTGVVTNLRQGEIVRQGDTVKTRLDQ